MYAVVCQGINIIIGCVRDEKADEVPAAALSLSGPVAMAQQYLAFAGSFVYWISGEGLGSSSGASLLIRIPGRSGDGLLISAGQLRAQFSYCADK